MRWAVLVFVASCYSPAPYANCGVTCATSLDCPTDQSCFAGRCSAREGQCTTEPIDAVAIDVVIDGSPNADEDGDGLSDAIDKCPGVLSPDNRDHDNDGLGDICDPCPMFIENANSDTDKIGDKCDPRPGNGADVATFYGFYDPAEYTTWTKNGMWVVNNGKLVGTNPQLSGAVFESTASFGGNVSVRAAIETTGITVSTSDRVIGVSVRRNTSGHYEGCQLALTTAGLLIRARRFAGSDTDFPAAYSGAFPGAHQLRLDAFGGTDNCNIDSNAVAGVGLAAPGKVAIDSSLVNVAVDYLFVVTMN